MSAEQAATSNDNQSPPTDAASEKPSGDRRVVVACDSDTSGGSYNSLYGDSSDNERKYPAN